MKKLCLLAIVAVLMGCIETQESETAVAEAPIVETTGAPAPPVALDTPLKYFDHIVSPRNHAPLWEFEDASAVVPENAPFSVQPVTGLHPKTRRFDEIIADGDGTAMLEVLTPDGTRTQLDVLSCGSEVEKASISLVQEHHNAFMSCTRGNAESPMVIGHLFVTVAFQDRQPIGYSVSPASLSDDTLACIGQHAKKLRTETSNEGCEVAVGGAIF